MHPRCIIATGAVVLTLAHWASAAPADELVREFRYDAARVHVARANGLTHVELDGDVSQARPGEADLPVVGERVEIPVGSSVARLEIVTLETAPLADGARIAAVPVMRPGEPEPAPAAISGTAPPVAVPAVLGYQGFQRERHYAWVMVSPVRWDPASGRLERITRITVRLVLAPTPERPLERLRSVPAWDDSRPAATRDAARRAGLRSAMRATGIGGTRGRATPFRPTQVPSLLGSPVAYVIVTGDSLAAAFQPLADWKTQSGMPAVVRTMSFVRAQYPYGADDPEKIRMFIRDAYTRWGAVWVLLGGDTDVIPVRRAHIPAFSDEDIVSDLYYSCLDGNWNADGDSTWADGFASASDPGDNADLLPDVWVGRAPVVTVADVQNFVQKTLTYEKTPVADYMTRALFFAQVMAPQPWTPGSPTQIDGAQFVEQDVLPSTDLDPALHVARLYQNDTNPAWRPGALHETFTGVLDSLNAGYNFAVHIGHGFRTVMSTGDGNLTNNNLDALTNGNRLMNLYAIDCTSNAIDFSSIGEAGVRARNNGSVTNIGSTNLDFPTTGRKYEKEYFRLIMQDSVTAIGEAQGSQKLPFVGASYYDGLDRWTQLNLLLLGDPELRLFTNTPIDLSVTAPDSVFVTDSLLTVAVAVNGSPLLGARVTAWMAGREYESGLTDGSGNVTLPFRPDTLGTFTLTVTAFNARPTQRVIPVVAGSAEALAALGPLLLDDTTGGRQGNGNGLPDAGETFDIVLPLKNTGGTDAANVAATLSTTDGLVAIPVASAGYGTIAAGTTGTPAAGFRVSLPYNCPDQREIPFVVDVVDDTPRHDRQTFRLVVRAPDLAQIGHVESEPTGNGDGQPEPGETVQYVFRVRNNGTGGVTGLSGVLRSADGSATVTDSLFTLPDLAAGAESTSTAVRFVPATPGDKLWLLISDAQGVLLNETLMIGYPGAVGSLAATGGTSSIALAWQHAPEADLAGYNVYRATSPGGPYARVTLNPAGRTSTWTDTNLPGLARFYYEVSAVDSSGNESGRSAAASATTNPKLHSGFPRYTRESTPSPIAVDHVYSGYPQDIALGADVLHVFHVDGTAPVDADGLAATPGDFSTLGRYYAGGASIADLDGNGTREIIGGSWTTQDLEVFDAQGVPRAGFPVHIEDQMWSSIAVGDLAGDGHQEMVFASRNDVFALGREMYVFRSDGSEWMDGDNNPSTVGVFKVMGTNFNDGTPALADLLGNGQNEIVFASFDGMLYAWKPDGSDAPGFPVNLHAPVSSSVAIGKLDGAGGPLSIAVATSSESLYVFGADGSRHAGFPVHLWTTGTNRSPSPAIADMNGDGFPEIVVAGTDGAVYAYDRTGALVAPWTGARFSTLPNAATESSPVVADINGDGKSDVIIGDDNGSLAALSGADGSMLAGFPIQLDAEVTGTPAVCDCDGDGKTEIVDVDFGGTLYVWDYDFPFSPGGPPPWPQFHHDARRTGNATTPILLAVGDHGPASPRALALAAPRPNPARGPLAIDFAVPQSLDGATLDLSVYDLGGRRVRTIEHARARAGAHTLPWDLRDGRGVPARSGVYWIRLTAGREALTRKAVVLH